MIYTLPFYAHSSAHLVGSLLGGWSLSGIAIAESGFALSPGTSAPNTALAGRPNQVGPIHHNTGDRNHIFNADALQVPGYGFFGRASNGSIREPRVVGFNTAFYKMFQVSDRANFQFRAEAFNVANHPSFDGVNTGIGPNEPNPGLVNSPEDPRILEMVGRFSF